MTRLYELLIDSDGEVERLEALLRHTCEVLDEAKSGHSPLLAKVQEYADRIAELEATQGRASGGGSVRERAWKLCAPDSVRTWLVLCGVGGAEADNIAAQITRARELAKVREAREGAPDMQPEAETEDRT